MLHTRQKGLFRREHASTSLGWSRLICRNRWPCGHLVQRPNYEIQNWRNLPGIQSNHGVPKGIFTTKGSLCIAISRDIFWSSLNFRKQHESGTSSRHKTNYSGEFWAQALRNSTCYSSVSDICLASNHKFEVWCLPSILTTPQSVADVYAVLGHAAFLVVRFSLNFQKKTFLWFIHIKTNISLMMSYVKSYMRREHNIMRIITISI